MEYKKYLKYILAAYGAFYLLLPHTIHMKYSPDWLIGINLPHPVHLVLGAIFVIWAYVLFRGKK